MLIYRMIIPFLLGVVTGSFGTTMLFYFQFKHDAQSVKDNLDISDELKDKYDDL